MDEQACPPGSRDLIWRLLFWMTKQDRWTVLPSAGGRADNTVSSTALARAGGLLASAADGRIALLDADSGVVRARLDEAGAAVRGLLFLDGGAQLVSASGAQLLVWDVAAQRVLDSRTKVSVEV